MSKKAPKAPDYGAANREAVLANLEVLPFQAQIEAASAAGKKITLDGKTYDFTNLGDADVMAAEARKFSAALLDLQRKYGGEYVQQRLSELELAQPEQVAARKDLFKRIMAQIGEPPGGARPINAGWQEQILRDLRGEGALTTSERTGAEQGVRAGQVARENFLGNAATTAEATAVAGAGEAKRESAQARALQFLASGATPEDIEYRGTQQNLANLSNFISGQTPTAEFAQISGAQNQAAPFSATYQPVKPDPNAGRAGTQFAQGVYGAQANFALTQANPWLGGLSVAANAIPVFAGFGGGAGGGVSPSAWSAAQGTNWPNY